MQRLTTKNARITRVKAARLYLEDLEELYEIASRVGYVRVTVNQTYLMDSISEIKQEFTKNLDSLELFAIEPDSGISIEIELKRRGSTIYCQERDDIEKSAIRDALRLVEARKRRFASVRGNLYSSVALVVIGFIVVALFAPVFAASFHDFTVPEWLISVPLASGVSGAITWFTVWESPSIIHPQYKKDSYSFWESNRDQIVLILISAFVSGFIGFGLGMLSK